MAVLLLVGSFQAMAQTVLYERGTSSTTAWSNSDLSDWTGSNATASISGGLYIAGGNNSAYELTKSLTFTQNSLITLKATWNVGVSTGRAGSYNYMTFGGIQLRSYGQEPQTSIVIGTNETILSSGIKDDARGGVWKVELTIDQSSGDCTYSVTMPSGTKEGTALVATNPTGIALGFFKSGRVGDTNQTLQDIVISEKKQDVKTASYKVVFKTDDNVELRTEVRTGRVGSVVNITDDDKAPIWKDGVKFVYASNTVGATVASDGSTVVEIIFTKAKSLPYTLKAIDGEGHGLAVLAEGEAFDGETKLVYYTKAVKSDDTWYMTAQRTSEPYYGINITAGTDATVVYNESDATYFSEVEDLTPSHAWAANGGAVNRYANGVAVRLYKQSYVATAPLESGIYTFTLRARNGSSSQTANLPLYLVDADGVLASTPCAGAFADWGTAEQAEKTVEGIAVPEGCAIALNNNTDWNSNLELDYVYAVRTGDLPMTTYTMLFALDGGVVVKSEVRPGVVGGTVTLLDTDKLPFTVEDDENTYLYVSDNSEGLVIAEDGSTVVIITCKAAEELTCIIRAVDGEDNELGIVAEKNMIETTSDVVYYTKAIKSGDKWYMIGQNSTDPYYGVTMTAGEEKTLVYSETDITYFSEVEALTASHSWAASGNYPGRYSAGEARRLYKNSYVKTDAMPAGVYTVSLRARNNSGSQSANLPLYLVDADGNISESALPQAFEDWAKGAQAENTVEGVEIPNGYSLAFFNTTENNSNLELDYVCLTRTANLSLLGDLNGDNERSVADVSLLVRFLVFGETDGILIENADVDGDTEYTVNDVTSLVSLILNN